MNNNEILEEFDKYWEENITNFESGILRKKVKSFLVQVLSDKDKSDNDKAIVERIK